LCVVRYDASMVVRFIVARFADHALMAKPVGTVRFARLVPTVVSETHAPYATLVRTVNCMLHALSATVVSTASYGKRVRSAALASTDGYHRIAGSAPDARTAS